MPYYDHAILQQLQLGHWSIGYTNLQVPQMGKFTGIKSSSLCAVTNAQKRRFWWKFLDLEFCEVII